MYCGKALLHALCRANLVPVLNVSNAVDRLVDKASVSHRCATQADERWSEGRIFSCLLFMSLNTNDLQFSRANTDFNPSG